MTYANVYNNLVGEDRADAIRAMEDDAAFDRWLAEYDRKQQMRHSQTSRTGSASKKRPANISKEEFLARTGGVYG